MTIIAKLKALLHLDNTAYKQGIQDATGQTVSFKREVRATNDSLAQTSKMSAGLAAIFQGNLVRGIKLVTQSLVGMNTSLGKIVGSLGAIGAAAGAGWMAGRKLDEKFGISKKFSDWMNKLSPEEQALRDKMDAETAGMRKERRGQESSRGRAAGIAEDTEEMRRKRLKGLEKIEAEFAHDIAAIDESMNAAVFDSERAAWRDRMQLRKQMYDEDVLAFKAAEAKKVAAIKQERIAIENERESSFWEAKETLDERKQGLEDRARERVSSIQSIKPDRLMQMGGQVGPMRKPIGMENRALTVQLEQVGVMKELTKALKDFDRTVQKSNEHADAQLEKLDTGEKW